MAFDQSARNRLQKFVSESRSILTEEFTRQLQAIYGMDPKNGLVAEMASLSFLDNQGRQTAKILRETLEHYKASLTIKSEKERNKQGIKRIIREQSFTVLNRLGALRMAEARGFLLESIANGYSSKGFQLYKNLAGSALGETGDAYRQYLFSIFDEFSQDLAVLFDRNSSQGLLFPRESVLLSLLDQINHFEIENLWVEDETIGWIYQYWNGRDEIDEMRLTSRSPRSSREMAVRNQFFTPRYVVEFLTDNTLGRIWYEMTQGKTVLVKTCRYLVRRPNEVFLGEVESAPENESEEQESLSQEELLKQPFYIPFRELKDPRELRMLDPACGSMHFGLYAFNLFEEIYEEAWRIELESGPGILTRSKELMPLQTTYSNYEEFRIAIPSLIIEYNIHGVDIDPRAVQIAGLSLWQRAQRAWHQMGIKPNQRPTIRKSNIICAEPMPGEKEMLREFVGNLNPPVLRQLIETIFNKMELAGEAGTLLKIEEEIASTINKAKDEFNKELLRRKDEQEYFPGFAPEREATLFDFAELTDETSFWDTAEERILESLSAYADQAESVYSQKRLFAEDAAKGFAFINLCRKRFDVVLMNPPFGEASVNTQTYINTNYPYSKGNILANFVERAGELITPTGEVGTITSRSFLYLTSMADFRQNILDKLNVKICVDMGDGVLDAMVETAVYTLSKRKCSRGVFFRCLIEANKESKLKQLCNWNNSDKKSIFISSLESFNKLAEAPFTYWVADSTLSKLNTFELIEEKAKIAVGLQTGDDFRFYRNFWEVPTDSINRKWFYTSKTETAVAWHSPFTVVVNWENNGYELSNFYDAKGKLKSRPQNIEYYFSSGFSYMARSTRLIPYVIPEGCIPVAPRAQVFPKKGFEVQTLAICASNIGSSIARFRGESFARPLLQAGMVQKINFKKISETLQKSIENKFLTEIKVAKAYYSSDETTLDFLGVHKISEKYPLPLSLSSLIGEENEALLAEEYGLNRDEFNDLQLDLQQAVSLRKNSVATITEDDLLQQAALNYLSFLIGCAFGRWDNSFTGSDNISDVYEKLPCQPPAFKISAFNGYIELNGISDIDSDKSLTRKIETITLDNSDEVDRAFSLCGMKDLSFFLSKTSAFFDYHLKQYSQNRRPSPIYWPLQTPSGSYTLWVYYHRLTEQTLYICINDFLEGPKGKLTEITDALNALRNKTARSSAEEKELSRFTDLEAELKDFRDELLRLAKFWKPNLNDGVQITAAPLWKLFQHKQWQKKLKETWDKLEKGDYDWAHLAYNIWPERVLRKCHEDRSLAIAHNVENEFWEEVEIPVIRRGKDSGETKVEWQPKKLNEDALKKIIFQKIAELK